MDFLLKGFKLLEKPVDSESAGFTLKIIQMYKKKLPIPRMFNK